MTATLTPRNQYPPSFTPTSTVTFLEDEAAALGRAIEGINEELSRNERDRDHLRDRRAELSRAMVEMRVAANLLRGTGLRSEVRPDGPFVEVPNPPPAEVPA